MELYYELYLENAASASFATGGKSYYGSLEQIGQWIEFLRADEHLCRVYEDTINAYDRYMAGEGNVTHRVGYHDVPILEPTQTWGHRSYSAGEYQWLHGNIWDYQRLIRFSQAEITHLWIDRDDSFYRCIRADFENLQYRNYKGEWEPLGQRLWGLPGQIVGKNGNLSSRFFVNEKYFKNQGDMILDMERFSQEPDPIYQGIMEDIFGDG